MLPHLPCRALHRPAGIQEPLDARAAHTWRSNASTARPTPSSARILLPSSSALRLIAALETGQIEAFTGWEPTPAIAEAKGIGRMLRTYGDVALVPASIHTTKDFAYDNEGTIVKFLAAHLEKQRLIEDDPEQAAELASQAAAQKGVTVSPEAFETVFQRIDFSIDFDHQIIEAINDTADFLLEQGKISEKPKLAWDRSFLDKAFELVGE